MLKKTPVREGEIAAPTERAIAVTPEAAERSSGSTTAMVYDWRVGTSICEMLKRSKSTRIASGRDGISGTNISRILDGMWVKTIVLIRPIFLARRPASRAEIARQQVGAEEDAADKPGFDPKAHMEPVGDHALDDQSTGESVQGEQGAQAEDHVPGAVQTERPFGGIFQQARQALR